MEESRNTNNIFKEIIVYKESKPFVKRALKDGRIDYLDMTKWTFIDKFFAFLISVKFFLVCFIVPDTTEIQMYSCMVSSFLGNTDEVASNECIYASSWDTSSGVYTYTHKVQHRP
jgi:hypothetical protein